MGWNLRRKYRKILKELENNPDLPLSEIPYKNIDIDRYGSEVNGKKTLSAWLNFRNTVFDHYITKNDLYSEDNKNHFGTLFGLLGDLNYLGFSDDQRLELFDHCMSLLNRTLNHPDLEIDNKLRIVHRTFQPHLSDNFYQFIQANNAQNATMIETLEQYLNLTETLDDKEIGQKAVQHLFDIKRFWDKTYFYDYLIAEAPEVFEQSIKTLMSLGQTHEEYSVFNDVLFKYETIEYTIKTETLKDSYDQYFNHLFETDRKKKKYGDDIHKTAKALMDDHVNGYKDFSEASIVFRKKYYKKMTNHLLVQAKENLSKDNLDYTDFFVGILSMIQKTDDQDLLDFVDTTLQLIVNDTSTPPENIQNILQTLHDNNFFTNLREKTPYLKANYPLIVDVMTNGGHSNMDVVIPKDQEENTTQQELQALKQQIKELTKVVKDNATNKEATTTEQTTSNNTPIVIDDNTSEKTYNIFTLTNNLMMADLHPKHQYVSGEGFISGQWRYEVDKYIPGKSHFMDDLKDFMVQHNVPATLIENYVSYNKSSKADIYFIDVNSSVTSKPDTEVKAFADHFENALLYAKEKNVIKTYASYKKRLQSLNDSLQNLGAQTLDNKQGPEHTEFLTIQFPKHKGFFKHLVPLYEKVMVNNFSKKLDILDVHLLNGTYKNNDEFQINLPIDWLLSEEIKSAEDISYLHNTIINEMNNLLRSKNLIPIYNGSGPLQQIRLNDDNNNNAASFSSIFKDNTDDVIALQVSNLLSGFHQDQNLTIN